MSIDAQKWQQKKDIRLLMVAHYYRSFDAKDLDRRIRALFKIFNRS